MPEAPSPSPVPDAPALRTAEFDYDLPERLIAQAPARPRDSARLLVVREAGLDDRGVLDLPALLDPGDVLVVNDTRVIPARLHGRRGEARVEIMLNRAEGGGIWHALVKNARRHALHQEWAAMDEAAAAAINAARAAGRRVVAVGTTALRVTETAARADGSVAPFRGLTGLYILPGYRFRAVDALVTNFHLPKSTLLMLVSAFAGTRRMRAAYAHAIAQGYRFFSYGDGSLLFRCDQDIPA